MKNRVFVAPFISTLLLSAMIAPAFAQQSNAQQSNSNPQSAASADQSASKQDFWDGEEPSLGALIFHPFATKEYVRRHVEPVRDRVNELEELTESHRKMIRDVDSRAQQGIQLASVKANAADEHAVDAGTKAQAAHQMTAAVDTRLTTDETVVGNIDQYKSAAQTEIRFRAGQTVLSKEAKDALDEMAAPLKDRHGYILEVQGFASGRGQAAIASSRKTADAVVRYLVLNHEIPSYRIYVIAMGDASTSGTKGSRVEVNLLKNDLGQIARQ